MMGELNDIKLFVSKLSILKNTKTHFINLFLVPDIRIEK